MTKTPRLKRPFIEQGIALRLALVTATEASDLAKQSATAEFPPCPDRNCTTAELEQWADAETAAEFKYGLPEKQRAVWNAEDALINWTKEAMQIQSPAQYKQIAICFLPNNRINLSMRNKLVAICLRAVEAAEPLLKALK